MFFVILGNYECSWKKNSNRNSQRQNFYGAISVQLSNQNIRYVLFQSYLHLEDLNIANNISKTRVDVDLLVVLDFFYNFITGNLKNDQIREPIAAVYLGWILTGLLKSNLVQTWLSDTHLLRFKPGYQTFDETSHSIFVHLFVTLSQ